MTPCAIPGPVVKKSVHTCDSLELRFYVLSAKVNFASLLRSLLHNAGPEGEL